MGCGVSSISDSIATSVMSELLKLDRSGGISALTPMIIKKLATAATEAIHDKLLVQNRDIIKTTARTGAEGVHEPPEGETLDGLLGVTTHEKISKLKHSLNENNLFCDDTFPADNTSLCFTKQNNDNINWLRPKDMTPDPKLIVHDIAKKDVIQGKIGDCWFLSTLAAITTQSRLMRMLIPKGQVLYGKGYTGLVVFHFWRFGRWVTVCIDDQLPTQNGDLMYSHCKSSNEFWVPLIEKAYAKLYGSYEALEGGQPMDAMVDLTGGLAECYQLHGKQVESFRRLLRAYKHGSFITCSRKGDWSNAPTDDKNGLVSGHSYTVTHVTTVPTNSGQYVNLIRIRNPWGKGAEWDGSWSDSSFSWNQVDEVVQKHLEVKNSKDGEFWMSFKDFCEEFTEVCICTLGPDVNDDGVIDTKNGMKVIRSAWELGKTCGGNRNNLQKFSLNPQFLLVISDEETYAEDEDVDLSGRRNVLISLMQEHRRSKKKFGLKHGHIGFAIYKTDEGEKRLPTHYFMINSDMGTSGPHINHREVIGRFHLVPGTYVIIPSTFEPDYPRPFLLRIYCDQKFTVRELK